MVKKLEYPDGLKTCTKCKETKSLDKYTKRANRGGQPISICKSCDSLNGKKWARANLEIVRIRSSNYKKANPEKVKAYKLKYLEDNSEKIKKYVLEYRLSHLAEGAARTAKRRAYKKDAQPDFADIKYLQLFFKIAELESKEKGIKYHVDHIVPLKSRYVCGLHYEHNLQVITASENLKKHNYYWPNMPNIKDKELIKLAEEFYAETI